MEKIRLDKTLTNKDATIHRQSNIPNTLVTQLVLLICQRLLQKGVNLLIDLYGELFQNHTTTKEEARTSISPSYSWMMILNKGNKTIKRRENMETKTRHLPHRCFSFNFFCNESINNVKIIFENFKIFKPRLALSKL